MQPAPRTWLALAAALLWLSGCSQTAEREPPAELTAFTAQARAQRVWQIDIGSEVEPGVVNLRPYVLGNNVYTLNAQGRLGAYALDSGKRHWTRDLGQGISAGLGGDAERLYAATHDGELLALAAGNGELLWRARMAGEILTIPVAGAGTVVVRAIDGRVAEFEATTGAQIWSYKSTVPALSLRGVGEPLIVGRTVYLGLDIGRVVALDLVSGTRQWEQTITSPRGRSEVERLVDIDSTPVSDGDALFVSGFQGRVAMLAANSGATRWSRDMSSNQPLALDRDALFVVDEHGVLWALQRATGSALWRQDVLRLRGLTGAVAHGDYLVVGDFEGYLHWFARADGKLVARLRIDDAGVAQTPLVHGDLLLALSRNGELVAVRIAPLPG